MADIMPNRIENIPSTRKMIKQNQKRKIQVSKLADVAKKAVWPALVFNLSLEPAFKFNLCVFGDKSNDIQSRTSYFTKNQVIYLETEDERYEICRKPSADCPSIAGSPAKVQDIAQSADKQPGELSQSQVSLNLNQAKIDPKTIGIPSFYTFSRVLNPHLLDNHFYALEGTSVPLEQEYKEVIGDDLDWHDFIWSDYQLIVKDKKYQQILNFKLYDIKAGNDKQNKV